MSGPSASSSGPRPTAPPESLPVLDLEHVDVPAQADPSIILVRDLNWRVLAGEHWLVTGPPGVGKSTVLQVAAGLIRPARGRHRLFGTDVTQLDERQLLERRMRIGMVFGGSGRLFTHLTVTENLALPLLYHAAHSHPQTALAKRLEQTLDGLGLAAYARRRPPELPRALIPRVALARALVLAPEILLLDDPTGPLPSDEAAWWRGFFSACSSGCCPVENGPSTWILAASDPRRWHGLANRFATLEDAGWRILTPGPDSDAGLRPAARE